VITVPASLCPDDSNNDMDNDGVCVGTRFNSSKTGGNDNCSTIANSDQANLDGDSLGNACDTDADGDTYTSVASGGTDCNDLDASINPGRQEVLNNGKDDDCNTATADRAYDIVFTMDNYDIWFPTDGGTANVTATVVSSTGTINPQPAINFTLVSVTNIAGKYTNDTNTADLSQDYDYTFSGNQINLISHDFGGSITIRAQAAITLADGTPVNLQNDFTLPKDTDSDGLPDALENQYGNLTRDGDIDTSVGSTYTGDGLTNFEEYRGFIWGPPLGADTSGLYKTTAYIPQGTAVHFRAYPNRKDLFIKYSGYNDANPFALGAAFKNVGIDEHVVNGEITPVPGEQNIDAVLITNGTKFGFEDGHINKRAVRDWSWDTKGSTGALGDATNYGAPTFTYQSALDGYFNDKPYTDKANTINGKLDPISSVEDANDNGTLDRREDKNGNSAMDDDLVVLGSYNKDLTVFDIDNDGKTELPVTSDPNPVANNTYTYEYSKAHVLMHTITHEIGHAIGMAHNSDSTCLMYEYSNNWDRAGSLSDYGK